MLALSWGSEERLPLEIIVVRYVRFYCMAVRLFYFGQLIGRHYDDS